MNAGLAATPQVSIHAQQVAALIAAVVVVSASAVAVVLVLVADRIRGRRGRRAAATHRTRQVPDPEGLQRNG